KQEPCDGDRPRPYKKISACFGDGVMGVDFIKKAAPTFHKALDRRAVELRTPTLFNRDIPSIARSASAEICQGSSITPGEQVHLRILNNKLIAQRDNVVVDLFARRNAGPLADFGG